MAIKIVNRRGIYYARGTYRGIEVNESLRTRNKHDAEALCTRIEQRILNAELHGGAKVKTFAEGVVIYWQKGGRYSARTLGLDLETGARSRLLAHFGEMPMSAITEDEIARYVAKAHPDAKASTVNREVIGPIKAVLKTNRMSNLLEIDKWREARVERPYATPEYLRDALDAYAGIPRLHALVLTMAATGRRVGEVLDWKRKDIDWNEGQILIPRTKNGRAFTVKLAPFLLEAIEPLPNFANGTVFGYASRWSLYQVMKRRCKKVNIPYLTPHEIGRHTFATWAVKYCRLSIAEVQRAGGWESISALSRYTHLVPQEAQERASDNFGQVLSRAKSVQSDTKTEKGK